MSLAHWSCPRRGSALRRQPAPPGRWPGPPLATAASRSRDRPWPTSSAARWACAPSPICPAASTADRRDRDPGAQGLHPHRSGEREAGRPAPGSERQGGAGMKPGTRPVGDVDLCVREDDFRGAPPSARPGGGVQPRCPELRRRHRSAATSAASTIGSATPGQMGSCRIRWRDSSTVMMTPHPRAVPDDSRTLARRSMTCSV